MLFSRITPLLRLNNRKYQNVLQITRNSSHQCNYRSGPPPPEPHLVKIAELVQGFAWWWVLWHLWTDYGHIVGEFEYPDPRKWTDAELGIPSD